MNTDLMPPGEIAAGRLLVHVAAVTAHAERLGAAPLLSVSVLNKIAVGLMDAGQLDTSRPLFDRALRVARAQLGPDHPDTLRTRSNLATWLGEAGRVQDAAGQFERLLADQARVLGPDHPATLTTRGNLATCLGRAERVQKAAGQFERLLADRAQVLGPDHPDTLNTRNNLSHWKTRLALAFHGGSAARRRA
jgi:tetratricopeptide (TPR) repeat protein